VLVVEHQLDVIAASDWVIELGPGGGIHGGLLVAEGPPDAIRKNKKSPTGRALAARH
jgi:excinuclease ABC subunit A